MALTNIPIEELTFVLTPTGLPEDSVAVIVFDPTVIDVPDANLGALVELFLGGIEQAREAVLRRLTGIGVTPPTLEGPPNVCPPYSDPPDHTTPGDLESVS